MVNSVAVAQVIHLQLKAVCTNIYHRTDVNESKDFYTCRVPKRHLEEISFIPQGGWSG